MRSATRALFTSAMLAVANAQGVIVKAVGDSGTSTGLQGMPHYWYISLKLFEPRLTKYSQP